MKNFKKIAMLLVALMVAMSVLLVMASCGNDGTGESSQGGQSSTDGSTESSGTGNGSTDNSGSTNNSTGNSSTDNSGSTDSSNSGNNPDNPPVDENPNLVKVTVLNQLGKPVKDAEIQICQGETCFNKPIITGNNGVGTREYTLGTGTLKAKINSIDGNDDFIASSNYVYFDEGSRELTITVQKVTVNVFDDKENAIEGAVVQLIQGEAEFGSTIISDADGIAFAYVADNGENLSARVTEILSGSGYTIEKKATEFEAGEFEATIVVKKNASYSVRLSTLFGDPVSGAKVKLYSGKILEDVGTTNASGIVTFENLEEGSYSVEVSFVSPAYMAIGANETDGRHYFMAGSTTLEISVIDIGMITYTLTVNGSTGGDIIDILNLDNEVIETIETDENGVATFFAENGYYTAVLRTEGAYAAPVFFVKDDAATGKFTVTNKTAGSGEDAPIFIVGETTVSFEAGKTVWFAIPNANKKTVTVISENGVSTKLGGDLDFVGTGEAEFVTDAFVAGKGELVVIAIKSESAQDVTVKVNAPGTVNEPIDMSGELGSDSTSYNVSLEADGVIYFTYTATEDGAISVTLNGGYVVFNGFDTGIEANGAIVYPIVARETVSIALWGYETADTSVQFAFGEVKIDYTVSVSEDGIGTAGIVAILYAKDAEGNLTEIARATSNEHGECVFVSVPCADNYIVKVEEFPEGYEAVYEEVEFLTYNYTTYALTTIKTGEPEAPFEFDTYDALEETVSVPENGTVWYTVYVRPSVGNKYYIVTKSDNAVIMVYNSDTNEDGIIDANDTPIGTAITFNGETTYVFETNNANYTIAVSTLDGSAEEIEIVYASQELPEGTTEENAIEITEAGTYTANVDGMVYYVFAGNDECKLTITVTGDVTLKVVHRSMDETTLEDVEGNTYTVDTEGTWIYFAISAENAGEYEFTVTVE